MKNLLSLLYTLLLLAHGPEASSQATASIWKLEAVQAAAEKHKELFKSLSRSGYQLDVKELQQNRLVLIFDDLSAIGQAVSKTTDRLVITSALDTLLSLSREELWSQLYPQFQAKEKGNTDKRNFKRALKGKRRTIRSANKPYRLYFGQISPSQFSYSFTFSRKDKPHTLLSFNTVAAQQISKMPYLEYSNCSPFDRLSFFRDISRRHCAGTTPIRYSPIKGVERAKTFKLYFGQNKAEYSKDDLAGILQFLKDSLYVIEKAEIKAWASVEGSLENNFRLQEKRAQILIQALEQHIGDSISYTVTTEENWSLFYDQLRLKGIDSTYRSQEAWKEFLVNKEELVRWEPLLMEQRKAEVKLYVTVKLTDQQKQRLAILQFRKLDSSYNHAPRERKASIVKAMLGIRNYLEKEVLAGRMEARNLSVVYQPNRVYEYGLINFYELADRLDSGSKLPVDFEEMALQTFENIKIEYSTLFPGKPNDKEKKIAKLYGDLVSVQAYLYQKIIQKKFSPQLACKIYLSDDPKYYHLYLNFLKFTNALKADPTLDVDCRSFASAEEDSDDKFDWRAIDADSRYYYMLKKLILDRKKLDVVWRTDWMEEFDLYEFLHYNIYYWDPKSGYFFDKEIGVKEMALHISKLISSNKRLCTHQVYGLAIAFHTKVLQEACHQQQKTEQLKESLTFIERFFLQHADELDGAQATSIVQQLLLANSYNLRNEQGRFAIDLLERVAKRKGLTGEQKMLYFDLAAKTGVIPKMAP